MFSRNIYTQQKKVTGSSELEGESFQGKYET